MTPPRKGTCNAEGCSQPRVRGAFLCTTHLGDKRRCEGRVRTYDEASGEVLTDRQCKRSAKPGLLVCHDHGGNSPKAMEASSRTKALTRMEQFATPYSGTLDPVTAFELEFRRTYGRILWLEGMIGALTEEELTWGLTQEDDVRAAEFTGVNRRYQARTHIYEEMLWRERKHFIELEKVWIKANLGEQRLAIMRDHINYTYTKVIETARALGHNPEDETTRQTLMGLFTSDTAALD